MALPKRRKVLDRVRSKLGAICGGHRHVALQLVFRDLHRETANNRATDCKFRLRPRAKGGVIPHQKRLNIPEFGGHEDVGVR